MPLSPRAGMCVISVNLDHGSRPASAADRKGWEATAERLFEILGRHRVRATFASSSPAASRHVARILAAPVGGEVALLGDGTWVTPDRARFAAELSRQVARARAAGYAITTLALRDVDLVDHADLLVKHGISVVRGQKAAARRSTLARLGLASLALAVPHPIRFGLWEIAPSAMLHADPARAIQSGPAAAAATSGLFHLAIDVPLLAEHDRGGLESIDRLLANATRLRAEGQLVIDALAGAALRLCRAPKTPPATSILRPRAA